MLEFCKSFISCTIAMIPVYIFGYIIFGKKENLKRNKFYTLIILLIGTILHTLVYMYLTGTVKTLLLCAIFAFTLKLIFNVKIVKVIFTTIIYTILLIIPDLITTVAFINIFNISKENFYSNFAGGILCNTAVSGLMIVITLILKKPLRKMTSYNLSTSKKIIFVSVLTILFIAMFFYKFSVKYQNSNDVIFYLAAIIAFMITLFILLKQKIDGDTLKNRYDELLEIMKTYENDVEEQRTIFHETKNEFMIVRCKIDDKEDNQSIMQYIDSILDEKSKKKTSMIKYAKFKYLPSNGLKGFFYYKFMEAEKKNIKVSVNISKNIENSFLGELETNDFKQLTRIIGVYLDNAIEASYLSDDKKLGIEVYLIKDNISIIISNTFNNNIESEKLGNIKFSTKGKNRGHGLLLVKNILNNSSIFESKNEINDNIFIQKLTIKSK